MSYGMPQCELKILYDDGSWQTILPGYLIDDQESETLDDDLKEATLKDAPECYYFYHPVYGLVLAADLDSIKIEMKELGGKVILN